MRRALLICVLCGTLNAAAYADGNTGLIYGRVLTNDANKPPCPVPVTASSDHQPSQVAFTSHDGSFHFLSVMPGRVTLTIGDVTREVTVSANIANMDAYVRPIYITQRHVGFMVLMNNRPGVVHSSC